MAHFLKTKIILLFLLPRYIHERIMIDTTTTHYNVIVHAKLKQDRSFEYCLHFDITLQQVFIDWPAQVWCYQSAHFQEWGGRYVVLNDHDFTEATSTTTTRRPPFDSFSWIPTQTQNWWTPKPVQSTQPPTGTNTTNHFAVTDGVSQLWVDFQYTTGVI